MIKRYGESETSSSIMKSIIFSTGLVTQPTIVKNGTTGELTIGTGSYNLCTTPDFTGEIKKFEVAGGTFTIPNDGTTREIIVRYNAGTPDMIMGTEADYNDSDSLGIFTVSYNPLVGISLIQWGDEGLGLVNKINRKYQGNLCC